MHLGTQTLKALGHSGSWGNLFSKFMATFNNKSLDKLFKKDLNPIIFLKKKLDEAKNSNTELLDEICNLNDYYKKSW